MADVVLKPATVKAVNAYGQSIVLDKFDAISKRWVYKQPENAKEIKFASNVKQAVTYLLFTITKEIHSVIPQIAAGDETPLTTALNLLPNSNLVIIIDINNRYSNVCSRLNSGDVEFNKNMADVFYDADKKKKRVFPYTHEKLATRFTTVCRNIMKVLFSSIGNLTWSEKSHHINAVSFMSVLRLVFDTSNHRTERFMNNIKDFIQYDIDGPVINANVDTTYELEVHGQTELVNGQTDNEATDGQTDNEATDGQTDNEATDGQTDNEAHNGQTDNEATNDNDDNEEAEVFETSDQDTPAEVPVVKVNAKATKQPAKADTKTAKADSKANKKPAKADKTPAKADTKADTKVDKAPAKVDTKADKAPAKVNAKATKKVANTAETKETKETKETIPAVTKKPTTAKTVATAKTTATAKPAATAKATVATKPTTTKRQINMS